MLYLNHISKVILSVFFLFFISFTIQGEEHKNYKFREISPQGGFYYDGIQSIACDAYGFIWIMMDDNLYRFDGYDYKHYYRNFKQIDQTVYWKFLSLSTDANQKLLVSTNNGLFRYKKESDSFEKVLDEALTSLASKGKNKIIAINDSKLKEYNLQTNEHKEYKFQNQALTKISSFFIGESKLYIASEDSKIYKSNLEGQNMFLMASLKDSAMIKQVEEHNGDLWVLSNYQKLLQLDNQTGEVKSSYDFFEIQQSQSLVKMFLIDKFGEIWVASQRGVYILNPETGQLSNYRHNISDPYSLPNNSVWVLSHDLRGDIWIGMFSGRLCYVNLDEKERFLNFFPSKGGLNHSPVSCFSENSDYFWVGTEGLGVNQVDKKTLQFKYITADNSRQSISHNNIKSLAVDSLNRLWIGTYLGGLNCLDINTGKVKHYFADNNKEGLLGNSIREIILDGSSGLWIMYQIDELVLSYLSFKDESFKHYYFEESDYDFRFFDFYKDKSGIIWIISHAQLYKLDPYQNKTEKINLNEDQSVFLNAQSLTKDNKGKIWVGTIDNGLYEYNTKTEEVVRHTGLLNFDVSFIFSMIFDDDDNLWLGTDNGLFKYNTHTKYLMNFNEKDGLQGRSYFPLACFKDSNRNLFFGGTNGFTKINLLDIIPNAIKPQVMISQFFINNKIYKEDRSSAQSVFVAENELKLDYTQNSFGFTFSSDSYLYPEKNRFRYRLKNYDSDFNEVGYEGRTVFYSKIPPGNYILEVCASNNDGVWNDEVMQVFIKISPAPWFSVPAYILYVILIVLISLWLLKESRRKKAMELQLYLDGLEKAKNKELYDSQLRFFTNVSHDFRTPLFLMLASIEKIEKEGFKDYFYKLLKRNAQRLLNLVNELMDFQSVENELVELKVENLDINNIIKETAIDFMDYAYKKKIEFSYKLDENLSKEIYADKIIIEKVVMNLLDNAFKYTQEGGKISIETYQNPDDVKSVYTKSHGVGELEDNRNYFSIVVRDTGVGISKESIASVFDRFYKVKTVNHSFHLGSGIGLALVSSFVQLHKGRIVIYSERDKGTDIIVSFPVGRLSYNSDEFMQPDLEDERAPLLSVNKNYRIEEVLSTDEAPCSEEADSFFLREKKNLLLVEDNEEVRFMVLDFLKEDFHIIEANDGREALNVLNNEPVDIIVSDIMMPYIDGVSFCKTVKDDINYSYIPFIMLTAKGGDVNKLEGIEAGADAYFEKPINLALLKSTIKNFLQRQEQLKEYYAKNYFADSTEVVDNRMNNDFLKSLIDVIDKNIERPELNVGFVTKELAMSRTKVYNKVKEMTNMSIVEFILNYRLRKAAKLIIETSLSMSDVMLKVGIDNQSYFSRAFKKEFGETPTSFAQKNRK